jgi:hypothetical protein
VSDLVQIFHYTTFASTAYLALKRDCQYWATDVGDGDDDEVLSFFAQNDEVHLILIFVKLCFGLSFILFFS